MKTVVLMPAYNSAPFIGGLIERVMSLGISVLIVDDGSTDNSADIACAAKAMVLKHKINKGKGAALRTGIEYLKNTDCEIVIMMDSDGQHQPEEIKDFLKRHALTKAPVVIGDRMTNTARMPFLRRATNMFMSGIISKICRQVIADSQCGFRLVEKRVLDAIELKSSNYEIESEMLIKASREGFKIDSISISTVYREEKSYINPLVDTIRFMKLLFNTFIQK